MFERDAQPKKDDMDPSTCAAFVGGTTRDLLDRQLAADVRFRF